MVYYQWGPPILKNACTLDTLGKSVLQIACDQQAYDQNQMRVRVI